MKDQQTLLHYISTKNGNTESLNEKGAIVVLNRGMEINRLQRILFLIGAGRFTSIVY